MNLVALGRVAHERSTSPPLPAIGRTAEERLQSSGYGALRDISCIASNGVAYLHGRLHSYYLKQLAQEIAAGVEGVRLVVNKIEVVAPAHKRREV
jgi:osmotically-inducible protein OsmY